MDLNSLLALDGVIASRGGIPLIEQGKMIGANRLFGRYLFPDEAVSKAGAAVFCTGLECAGPRVTVLRLPGSYFALIAASLA
jgi:hypothetical protein